MCKFEQRMVSISLTVNTLLSLGVAWICLVSLDARPANTEGDLDELKRSYYVDNYLQISDGLTKDSDLKNYKIRGKSFLSKDINIKLTYKGIRIIIQHI